ncbi:MAG: peptidase pyroglutamyl peptidase [Microvirga sp.]|jgi:pyroglutamyl-peptidase|nr:peptidase pyroglutamyl peptidase [Microvirga sp.]
MEPALRPRLLVTGFGPFPGSSVNPSGDIARRVAASPRWRLIGAEAQAMVLPTAYSSIQDVLAPALRRDRYDAVLMIGVASRAKRVRVERRAANRASILSPDASGRRSARLSIDAGAPAYRMAAASPARVLPQLRRRGLPCATSQDAGRYLCNACYFSALSEPVPVLFLHIPKAPRRKPGRTGARRAWRADWRERLASAFVAVGIDLLALARREKTPAVPPCCSNGAACSVGVGVVPGRALR